MKSQINFKYLKDYFEYFIIIFNYFFNKNFIFLQLFLLYFKILFI